MKLPRLCLLAATSLSAMLTTGCFLEQVEKPFIPADNPYATPLPKLELQVPLDEVFRGKETFQKILAQAKAEDWRTLPMGERFAHVALALRQVPYRTPIATKSTGPETPRVNFETMGERWFIETSVAMARLLNTREIKGGEKDLLRLVQATRYRGGACDGTPASRMEIWDEIFHDNEKRGLIFNVTRQMGGVRAKRSLKKAPMAAHLEDEHGDAEDHLHMFEEGHKEVIAEQQKKWLEAHTNDLPLFYLKLEHLVDAEQYIQNGDLLALVSECGEGIDEVGIAVKPGNGRPCVLHMSMEAGHAVVDLPLTEYMAKNGYAGVMVVRPLEAPAF